MRTMQFPFVLLLLLISGFTKAQEAHSNYIDFVFTDTRGQVFMTVDRSEVVKVWNISDGKLVATYGMKSAEWHPKLMRYKINHPDYTLKGFEYQLKYENGTFVSEYRIDGEVAGRMQGGGGKLWNPETKKLILESTSGNTPAEYKSTLRIATFVKNGTDDDGNTNIEIKPYRVLPYIAQYETSPKATWLMSIRAEELMHFETGKITKIPADAKMIKNQHARFTFNPEETMLSVVTDDGICVIDIATATVVRRVDLPKKIKQKEGYAIYPLSDMQSFIYTGTKYGWGDKSVTKIAWLVKESGAAKIGE